MVNVDRAVTILDLQGMARRRLPKFLIEYIERGHGSGAGVRRNVDAFHKYQFVPRALVDVSHVETKVKVFGRTYGDLFGISAVGTAGLYRRGFDEMLAEIAREANIPFMLSGSATASIETISRLAPNHVWFQLYAAKSRALTDRTIARARDAGIQNLVFTVDYPIAQTSEISARTGLSLGSRPRLRNLPGLLWDAARRPGWSLEFALNGGMPAMESWRQYAPPASNATEIGKFYLENWPGSQNWDDLERIRRVWPGKLIVKGLVHSGDVIRAAELGADAVTVSNHGGNKLDSMQASVDALKEIKVVTKDSIPLFLDGGIRRGSDVVVAYSLGARYCFVGRAALYGIAAGGRAGGRRAIDIISKEIAYTMAMIGSPHAGDLGPHILADSGVASAGLADNSP
jgi:(S)-mandelate dehydrogenase